MTKEKHNTQLKINNKNMAWSHAENIEVVKKFQKLLFEITVKFKLFFS